MDPSPEYINGKLVEILMALRADAERVTITHRNQVMSLEQAIEHKEREIRELKEEVEGLRRAVNFTKVGDVQTASFKKITLGKRTPKSISQFTSEQAVSSPQMAHSVLVDQKTNVNTLSTRNTKNPSQSMSTSQSVKFFKNATTNNPAKPIPAGKENMNLKLREKKPSVPNILVKNDRTMTSIAKTPLSRGKLTSSIIPKTA
jgi:hypothetical protein